MKYVPLSREKHAAKRVSAMSNFQSVATTPLIAVFGAEISRALHEFPVVFSVSANEVMMTGVTGLTADTNLFVGPRGQWLGEYTPALFRRVPFLLGRKEDSDDWILCVDEDSDLLSDREGAPLFTADGTPSDVVNRTTAFLGELEKNRMATARVCSALRRLDVLVAWNPQRANGGAIDLPGLLYVDSERLNRLPEADLVELRDLGALPLIYGHLFSLQQFPLLERREAAHRQAAQERLAAQRAGDLDRVFGIVEDEPFQF